MVDLASGPGLSDAVYTTDNIIRKSKHSNLTIKYSGKIYLTRGLVFIYLGYSSPVICVGCGSGLFGDTMRNINIGNRHRLLVAYGFVDMHGTFGPNAPIVMRLPQCINVAMSTFVVPILQVET